MESYTNRETIVSNAVGLPLAMLFSHGQDLKQINKVNLKLFGQ